MTNGYFSWGSGLATLSNIDIRIPTGKACYLNIFVIFSKSLTKSEKGGLIYVYLVSISCLCVFVFVGVCLCVCVV